IFNHQTVSVANVIISTTFVKILIETALCIKIGVMANTPIKGDVNTANLKSLLISESNFILIQKYGLVLTI
ncbi:MAG: hypothetical protein JXB49_25545, partial [Bacteroidales bacterium]|nr:hypothetical protein [Bacteroidales bacterium]